MALIDRLPPLYKDSKEIINIQEALENERSVLEDKVRTLINDLFVITTKNINEWEKFVAIKEDATRSLEFRRERIIAKIRGQGTTTKQMIIDVASSFSNGEVEVIEDFSNYKFVIKFVGVKGIPANMEDLTLTIEEIKPAHLSFEFQYTYRAYDELKIYTNTQLNAYTHQNIREGVI